MGFLIFKGILAGLGISLLVGPLFFGLIQLSVERGFRAGVIFASGIWISDLLYVRVVQLGLGYIGNDATFQLASGIIGSLILIGFGLGVFFSPIKKGKLSTVNLSDAFSYFYKGVAINVFNPFVLLLWVSILSTIRLESIQNQWVFVGSMLSVVAATDVIKAGFSARIGENLKEARLMQVKRVSGVLLGCFGIALMVRTILMVS
ncbi:MAG: LysE family transporter [Bacteroidetes bacterium]|nr:LysE family transporter [Bacteroidota bacterium]